MGTYCIEVTWVVRQTMSIEATSPEEAELKAMAEADVHVAADNVDDPPDVEWDGEEPEGDDDDR